MNDDYPKLALIIGMDVYHNKDTEKTLEPLPSCKWDAEKMSGLVSDHGFGLYNGKIILGSKPLQDKNIRDEMEESILNFFSNARYDQILLFYFSGHGFIDKNQRYYIASSEANPDNGYGGLWSHYLIDLMNRSPSNQIVCIIDACYSGSVNTEVQVEFKKANSNYGEEIKGKDKGIHLLLSSREYDLSQSDEKEENSIYTKFILEGLTGIREKIGKREIKSVNDYGYVTPQTLHEYASLKTLKATNKEQRPEYFPGHGPNELVLAYNPDTAERYPTDIKKINKFSDLLVYYNVEQERQVDVREKTIDQILRQIKEWSKYHPEDRKKIILITGVPGCGKSWLTFKIMEKLYGNPNPYTIFEICGSEIYKYPIGVGNQPYPVFILDDRHLGIEGITGGLSSKEICDLIQKCTKYNLAGPIILSIRNDIWKRMVNGNLVGCNKVGKEDQKKLIQEMEISLLDLESRDVAEKVIQSFYKKTNGNIPPYKLIVDDSIKEKIIEKSKCNLIIIKIFFEEVGLVLREKTILLALKMLIRY